MEKLWGGRFSKGMEKFVEKFNASIEFDKILFEYDINGSIAHVTMLEKQGIVNDGERDVIIAALEKIKEKMSSGEIEFDTADEDIHMTVEKLLIKEVGDVGKKLHTARSRNDQNVLDEKLYLKDKTMETIELLIDMENVLLKRANEEIETIMPGFTHLQHAQPITGGFYYMAYFQKFRRDIERFISSFERLDYNPLGACALAGTTLPIDRHITTELLGFKNTTENALDTVSDRDYIIEYIFNGSMCMTHLSRFAEEFIIYNSQEFAFFDIDDSFCTGSSIMPQKKNPDMAELVRGKTGRVYGGLISLLTVMKGTPLSFNKDFQEDKEALFDCVETINACIYIFARMLEKTKINKENVEKHLQKGFINSTDIAEYFVRKGMPFREAHEVVGNMVKYCELKGKSVETLDESDIKELGIDMDVEDIKLFEFTKCAENRKSFGGTSPIDVRRQINVGEEFIKNSKDFIQ
jgi:argininosuccinate lyase